MGSIFFIIGAGRSGTTAMVEILNTATNSVVHTEQSPKLCIAARMRYEGILPHPKEFIYKSKNEKIEEALKAGKIYGDKNPNYLYFIQEMSEVWDCKFLFVIRDGRDVVRSCIDFHDIRGSGYARYEDDEASFLTQPEDNLWDFARIRPYRFSGIYKNWKEMDRFEKFSWSWSEYNRVLLDKSKQLDGNRYKTIDIGSLKAREIESIFDFLGLKGFELEKVSHILNSKINTTDVEPAKKFPHYKEWDKKLLPKFNKYAGKMMKKLGYY